MISFSLISCGAFWRRFFVLPVPFPGRSTLILHNMMQLIYLKINQKYDFLQNKAF